MTKINKNYVEKLFKYVEVNCMVCSPYNMKNKEESNELKRNLRPFLDTICALADESGITAGYREEKGSETDFHYFISYNENVLEIGMYFDYDTIYVRNVEKYNEEDVIDCNNIFKKKKRLVLDNKDTKKEDK